MTTSRIRHIYLTGFMGAGKSTVGRALGQRLGWVFLDLDASVAERCQMSIPQIFAERGQEWFRQQEHDALAAIPGRTNTVVAVGGGGLERPDNRRLMRQRGVTVWLDVPFSLILQRLDDGGRRIRPLFSDEAAAHQLFDERRLRYARADHVVQIRTEREPEAVADDILDLIGKQKCAI
ncbi:MAG: shikimate kinase [Thermoanaerobaculia bacterium]